jgi:NAD(P)-dependent dehydrogenase (short-subunit alcohol dehydrogenase family)
MADEGAGRGSVRSFTGKLAVVTGGGSGTGRELVRQLAAEGCSVAACDLNSQAIEETAAMARADAPHGVLVTGHTCDVADEAQVLRFRDEVLEQHASDHVDLVFNNAGIGGGGSFVKDDRDDWERELLTRTPAGLAGTRERSGRRPTSRPALVARVLARDYGEHRVVPSRPAGQRQSRCSASSSGHGGSSCCLSGSASAGRLLVVKIRWLRGAAGRCRARGAVLR